MNSTRILQHSYRFLPVAACIGAALDHTTDPTLKHNAVTWAGGSTCRCDSIKSSQASSTTGLQQRPASEPLAPAPTWLQKSLFSLYFGSLPLPRKITPGDPAFSDSKLKSCIRQRRRDEQSLRSLQVEIQRAQQSQDPQRIRQLFEKVTEIAYGKGITPQIREDFMAKYGCTGWTDEVLDELVKLAEKRGIVEIGAGRGQWARAVTEHFTKVVPDADRPKAFDFVLAYDDMTELPLSTNVYHKHTQPAHDYFFSKVKQSKDIHSVLRQWSCRGRVLMLVYPPQGAMARESIEAYTAMGPENDTVVYVGEGRCGSTADASLFDYIESGNWALVKVMNVQTQPGDKGYEKLFIFKRQSAS